MFSARAQNEFIFPEFTLPGWDKDTVKYFTVFPTCGGYTADQWYLVGGESQVVGPLCEWMVGKRATGRFCGCLQSNCDFDSIEMYCHIWIWSRSFEREIYGVLIQCSKMFWPKMGLLQIQNQS